MSDSLDTSEDEAMPWVKPLQQAVGDEDAPALSAEEKALGAFLAAMHDCHLDGDRMREAMLNALGLKSSAPVARITALEEELAVSDKLLLHREQLLQAIPECPDHGYGCVPHALEWIEEMKSSQQAERPAVEATAANHPADGLDPGNSIDPEDLIGQVIIAWSEWNAASQNDNRERYRNALAALYKRMAAQPAAVPPDVLAALDRMCSPLHESRLSGVTAKEDARCMTLIRDYVLSASPSPAPAVPACQGCGAPASRFATRGTSFPGTYCEECGPGGKPAVPDAVKVNDKVWAIDHTAGRPILVLNGCSVIEAEDAEYVLSLIRAVPDAAKPPMGYVSVIDVEKLLCEKLGIQWSATGISIVSLIDRLAAVPDAAKPEPKSMFTVDLAEHSIWKVRYYGSPDLKGYNIYAFRPGALTHGERIANLGEDGDTAEAICLAHNELAMALADEKETARQLNAALREAIEPPTFMGEPVLPAKPETQGERAGYVRWLSETYPDVYTRSEAERWWENEHVSVLAWKARALLSAGPARVEPLTASQLDSCALNIADSILFDLQGRKHLLDGVDEQVLQEIIAEHTKIIREGLAAHGIGKDQAS